MKSSRRNFTRAAALGALAAPFALQALSQQNNQDASDEIELRMKIIDVKISDARAKQIRDFLRQNTMREISVLRAWPVKRDMPPALGLGVFDI
jgi:hypothetical protein